MYLLKRKNIYYIAYFDEHADKMRRITTGEKKKAEALKFLSCFADNLKGKTYVKHITLSEFSSEYLTHVKINHSINYYETVKTSFKQLQNSLPNVALKDISRKQMEIFFSETFKRTKQGARTYFIALRSAFNKAKDWNYLQENPLEKMKLPKIPKNNPIFLTEDELLQVLEMEKQDLMRDLYQFAFHTGMRLSEITNCKWKSVDLENRIIKVGNSEEFTTKSKRERIIPINATLYALLLRRYPKIMEIDKNLAVFSKKGFKYNDDYIAHRFKRAVRNSKIEKDVHFHDLRHSFASNMIIKGVPIFAVKELLGHQSVSTTQIYSHLTIENLKEAVKVLEK